jgi:hypothetical protein
MNLAKVAHSFFLTAKDVKEDWVATSFSTTEGTEYTEELGVLLLGIYFLSEVVESIMRGGDRGLVGTQRSRSGIWETTCRPRLMRRCPMT